MIRFNLSNMVDDYGEPITVIRKTGGGYDDYGTPIPEKTELIEMKGIISVFSDDELQLHDGGKYNTDNVKLYVNDLINKSDVITHASKEHTVFYHRDYSTLAKPYVYGLKRRDNEQ